MKKRMIIALVLVAMLLSLAGCARKTTVSISLPSLGDYDIVTIPEGFANLGKQDGTMKLTVKKYGEYPIVIKAEDGTEHTIQVTYDKDGVTVTAGEGLDLIAGVE